MKSRIFTLKITSEKKRSYIYVFHHTDNSISYLPHPNRKRYLSLEKTIIQDLIMKFPNSSPSSGTHDVIKKTIDQIVKSNDFNVTFVQEKVKHNF